MTVPKNLSALANKNRYNAALVNARRQATREKRMTVPLQIQSTSQKRCADSAPLTPLSKIVKRVATRKCPGKISKNLNQKRKTMESCTIDSSIPHLSKRSKTCRTSKSKVKSKAKIKKAQLESTSESDRIIETYVSLPDPEHYRRSSVDDTRLMYNELPIPSDKYDKALCKATVIARFPEPFCPYSYDKNLEKYNVRHRTIDVPLDPLRVHLVRLFLLKTAKNFWGFSLGPIEIIFVTP